MTHSEIIKTLRVFFSENPCTKLNFAECKELRQGYNKAVKVPGCSSCAKRRARNKYSQLVREKIRGLDYEATNSPPPAEES